MENYTPIGMVKIEDENGNVLVEKHNMIVKLGRGLIFRRFIGSNNSNGIGNSTEPITKISFGCGDGSPASSDEVLIKPTTSDNVPVDSKLPAANLNLSSQSTIEDSNTIPRSILYNQKIEKITNTDEISTVTIIKCKGKYYEGKITGGTDGNLAVIKNAIAKESNTGIVYFNITSRNIEIARPEDYSNNAANYEELSISDFYNIATGEDNTITIFKTITPSSDISISELGLFTKENSTAQEELFSHLVFDAIPLTAGSSYTITYSIYF